MGQCKRTMQERSSLWPSNHNSSEFLENCLEVRTPHPKLLLSAKSTKRIVEEFEMGLAEFLSFLNLAFSADFMVKPELLHEEEKHDFVKPEAIIRSMVVSNNLWTSRPRVIMSPGLDLPLLR